MSVKDAALALEAALKTVPHLRVYADMGAPVDPPAVVVGPPAITFEAYCDEPTGARFLVFVIVPADERAQERLWDLVPAVARAIQGVPGATLAPGGPQANPGSWKAGTTELPSYEIATEVSL